MVNTRFAPSPTGHLHIGGVRTALFCWLYAKKNNGKFILRIEDTDLERSTKEATDVILTGMDWLGMDYTGPFYQAPKLDEYKKVALKLLEDGKAYKCYCTKERLESLREQQMKDGVNHKYDGHCQKAAVEQDLPFVVRFKMPTEGEVVVNDSVHGNVVFKNSELDDLIILRSDGAATYNLTVVVDDIEMQITHVIRGDDNLNNTPKQINLLKALGGDIPAYAHIPMILGADGKKLSKRSGATNLLQFREEGYLPEAILNYLVRLGWSSGDKEVFSKEEMIDLFDLSGINKSAAAINEQKLLWLNQNYLKSCDAGYIAKELAWHLNRIGIDSNSISSGPSLVDVVAIQKDRAKTLVEMAEKSKCFYLDVNFTEESKEFLNRESKEYLSLVFEKLSVIEKWTKENIKAVIKEVMAVFEIKMPMLAQPLRVAVTGTTMSPSVDATLQLCGRDKVLSQLKKAMAWID